MYQYILFDLDGTLTNPEIGITTCAMHALEQFGIHVKDRKELHPFIGPPLSYSFQTFYGLTEEESEQAIITFRERYSTKGVYENEMYPGVKELLESLKERGKQIILATSKPEPFAIEVLKYFDLFQYFDFIAGATLDGQREEKTEVITYALSQIEIEDKKQVIMVGDRSYDILGAKANGIDSLGGLYGFGSREELEEAGAKILVERVEEILDAIGE